MSTTGLLAPVAHDEDDELDRSLRPQSLADFVGQERVKEQLAIALEAAHGTTPVWVHVAVVHPPRKLGA